MIYLWGAKPLRAEPSAPAQSTSVVKRSVVGQKFVGDFYFTEGSPKKLGILVLGGSEGGLPDPQARFLSRAGFAVLAVAYFKMPGLPERLHEIPLEYFDPAMSWLAGNEHVLPGGIVVVGSSRGGELALLLSSLKKEIIGVVARSGSAVVWPHTPRGAIPAGPSWTLGGKPLPSMPFDLSSFGGGRGFSDQASIHDLYARSLKNIDGVRKATIKVEAINGPVLFLSGTDDEVWPSSQMGDMVCDRLKTTGFGFPYEHIKYEHAGHTLNDRLMEGGTHEGNSRAWTESSRKIIGFLHRIEEGAMK